MNKEEPKPGTKRPCRGRCTRTGIRTDAAVVVAGISRERRVMDEECVLVKRYGLDEEETATLAQLAEELGVSKERVRQLQREAEHMLRAA